MGAIPLDEAEPGMVLEREVVSAPGGRLLLPAGAELTQSHLVLLRIWGVTEVAVREVSREAVLERAARGVPEARRAAILAEIDELFRHADRSHPAVAELAHLATLRRFRQEAVQDADAR